MSLFIILVVCICALLTMDLLYKFMKGGKKSFFIVFHVVKLNWQIQNADKLLKYEHQNIRFWSE